MLFPKFSTVRKNNDSKSYEETSEEPQVVTDMRNQLTMAISEAAASSVETEEGTTCSKNVKTYSEAYKNISDAETDKEKVRVQEKEIDYKHQEQLIHEFVILAGILMTGVTTGFWLLLEQQAVVPQKLVTMTSKLITPRM